MRHDISGELSVEPEISKSINYCWRSLKNTLITFSAEYEKRLGENKKKNFPKTEDFPR